VGKELILYSRTDCALCLEMEEELRPILRDTSITVRPVNIEGDHDCSIVMVPVYRYSSVVIRKYVN